ncbi:hypothetical protein F2Q68_00042000 [Brassica cretica]|uniref:Aminotransferase class I/classII large domain-containing protein n=1 Tax=Brassica cretica TaxID=69181 RepID=A0A8S9MEH0_BRACR|nr:hypothetical protein F2Q68_00042000 [Brassica cretica]
MANNGNANGNVWQFKGNTATSDAAAVALRKLVFKMFRNYNLNSGKPILAPSPGDPSASPSFRTCPVAEEAVAAAARSGMANCYAPSPGILKARRAVADYLNGELPAKLKEEDVYITGGCNQAIEIVIDSLAGNSLANILLPRPGYPHYDARALYSCLEIRKYDLLPQKDWEIDLDGLEAAADENTVAMVLINPNNPCGNVYSYDHLNKVAEMARKLGGCNQAIEIVIDSLAGNSLANILLPRPGYPHYDARALYSCLEIRKYDLLPQKDWEIDLDGLEAAADENTVAMVLINPNNPCGNVYSYDHLNKVAEMARKLGIVVISDEVYKHVVYGDRPFIPMGIFASIAPVITLGSISKGWVVPGWRIGWIAMNDPNSILKSTGVIQAIEDCLELTPQPSLILQEALPDILEKTPKEFFDKKIKAMRHSVEFSCERLKDIPCLFCPKKPESCSYLWVHRKVIERGDISVEDEIADSVFMKVALPKFDEQQIKVDVNDKIKEEEDESESGSDEELGREDKKAARREHKKKRESLRRTRHPNLSRREKKISKPHKTR